MKRKDPGKRQKTRERKSPEDSPAQNIAVANMFFNLTAAKAAREAYLNRMSPRFVLDRDYPFAK